jgi:hypothetical protein
MSNPRRPTCTIIIQPRNEIGGTLSFSAVVHLGLLEDRPHRSLNGLPSPSEINLIACHQLVVESHEGGYATYRQIVVSNGLGEIGRMPMKLDDEDLDIVKGAERGQIRFELYQAVYGIQDVMFHREQCIHSLVATFVCEHPSLLRIQVKLD